MRQRWVWIGGLLLFLSLVGWLWREVFVFTGLLWWNAPLAEEEKIDPPEAPPLVWPDLSKIDLEEYRQQHLYAPRY
ncbi:MAG TPA: hypothetical protein EYP85_13715 [Armatimonadetes bacterium]|nr:hypothetical protein [Armatimonadota bacterium]